MSTNQRSDLWKSGSISMRHWATRGTIEICMGFAAVLILIYPRIDIFIIFLISVIALLYRWLPCIRPENDVSWDENGVTGPETIARLKTTRRITLTWKEIAPGGDSWGYFLTSTDGRRVRCFSGQEPSQKFLEAAFFYRPDIFNNPRTRWKNWLGRSKQAPTNRRR